MIDMLHRERLKKSVKLMLFRFWAVTHDHCGETSLACVRIFQKLLFFLTQFDDCSLIFNLLLSLPRLELTALSSLVWNLMNARDENESWFELSRTQRRDGCFAMIISTRSIRNSKESRNRNSWRYGLEQTSVFHFGCCFRSIKKELGVASIWSSKKILARQSKALSQAGNYESFTANSIQPLNAESMLCLLIERQVCRSWRNSLIVCHRHHSSKRLLFRR